MVSLSEILPLLSGVRRNGAHYQARCPAHDDRHASLGFGVDPKDGHVWLKCHVGCELKDIARALGKEPKEFFPEKEEPSSSYAWEIRDPEGNLVAVHHRKGSGSQKKIWWERNGKKGLGGLPLSELPLYRSQDIKRFDLKKRVFIPEGEKAADALRELGLQVLATFGADHRPGPEVLSWLQGFRVVLCPDNDKPGRKHMKQLGFALRGVAAKIEVWAPKGLPEKGDAYDWVKRERQNGREPEELRLKLEHGELPEFKETRSEDPPTPSYKEANRVRPAGLYPFTDTGNAERLVRKFGADLRYCHPWGKWLVWDGRRWVLDDTAQVERFAKKTVRSIYLEASKEEKDEVRKALAEWALTCESKAKRAALVELAKSEEGIPVLPQQLDADPWALNVLNGTLDLRTGQLRPHRRESLLTKLAPVAYDPQANCPTFLSFLERIMAHNDSMIRFLQRALGYSLTGDVGAQCLFFPWGGGSNGKSTLLNTFLDLLGDYGTLAPADLLLVKKGETHPTEKVDLFGKRFAVCQEVEEGRRWAEATLKQLTGGERVKARRMREDYWEFEPTHKLWIAANHKPVVRGTDYAIWRRIKLIPFTVTIPEEEKDENLRQKLLREGPGILRWAVEGCLAWQREGLGIPPEVKEATETYRAEMDVLGEFLADCCEVKKEAKTSSKELYDAYAGWCQVNGERPLSKRNFGQRLEERGFCPHKGTGGARYWLGLTVTQGRATGAERPIFGRNGVSCRRE